MFIIPELSMQGFVTAFSIKQWWGWGLQNVRVQFKFRGTEARLGGLSKA